MGKKETFNRKQQKELSDGLGVIIDALHLMNKKTMEKTGISHCFIVEETHTVARTLLAHKKYYHRKKIVCGDASSMYTALNQDQVKKRMTWMVDKIFEFMSRSMSVPVHQLGFMRTILAGPGRRTTWETKDF